MRSTVTPPRGPYPRFGKPALDRMGGVLLTLISLPLVVVIAIVIWAKMGPPVLFTQARVGKDGSVFRIYKFRTMTSDRRSVEIPIDDPDRRNPQEPQADPRVTPIGRALRRLSLDEIPQVWNVVLGDMSLVGPRPELVEIVEHYEPWQHQRHLVKPGITCFWQVHLRHKLPLQQATDSDLQYVEQVSLMTDIKLLLATIPAALLNHTQH